MRTTNLRRGEVKKTGLAGLEAKQGVTLSGVQLQPDSLEYRLPNLVPPGGDLGRPFTPLYLRACQSLAAVLWWQWVVCSVEGNLEKVAGVSH